MPRTRSRLALEDAPVPLKCSDCQVIIGIIEGETRISGFGQYLGFTLHISYISVARQPFEVSAADKGVVKVSHIPAVESFRRNANRGFQGSRILTSDVAHDLAVFSIALGWQTLVKERFHHRVQGQVLCPQETLRQHLSSVFVVEK